MATLLNPAFSIASATGTDLACRPCVATEAWVRQKRDPTVETLGKNQYLNGDPYAPNKIATWMATDADGAFYVLTRRQPTQADKPWYILIQYNACGDYINSIHINRSEGFGHYLDVTSNPQICVGPQGVVVVASPSFHPTLDYPTNLLDGQSNPFHVVMCFDLGSLALRWAITTRIGAARGFNDLHGIFANPITGHTYLLERWEGGGMNSGDIGMTTISEDGEVVGKVLLGLPSSGYSLFDPLSNYVDTLIFMPDASVNVFGSHGRGSYFYQTFESFSWSVIFSPNGSRVERDYIVSNVTQNLDPLMKGAIGCVKSDGGILIKTTGNKTFVLSSDGSSVIEGWPGGTAGRDKSAQIVTTGNGKIWWLETGLTYATLDEPTPGWGELQPLGSIQGSPTMRLRELSPDGKYVLRSKSVNVGPYATCGHATNSISLSRERAGMIVGGWGLVSFSLKGKTVGFDLKQSYQGAQFNSNTYAKFGRWIGSPFLTATSAIDLPVLSPGASVGILAAGPTFLDPVTTKYYGVTTESASNVIWDRYAASEL